MLLIIRKRGDWYEAEMNDRRGLVPSNYVSPLEGDEL